MTSTPPALDDALPLSADAEHALEIARAAQRLSANGFFNALMRETRAWQWTSGEAEPMPHGIRHPAVRLPLPATGAALWLNARYRSRCGRHLFELPAVLCRSGREQVVTLDAAVRAVAGDTGLFPEATAEQRVTFFARFCSSVENLGRELEARWQDWTTLFDAPLDFAGAEQGLLAGHSMHPTPKGRELLCDADARRYAPEFGASFALQWLAVARPQVAHAGDGTHDPVLMTQMLLRLEGASLSLPRDMLPLPAHPWQWARLREDPRVAALIGSGAIVPLGSGDAPWRATSSLRAVHGAHSPWMLEFAMSLRPATSLPGPLAHETARGLDVSRIRATPPGREFTRRYPAFQALAEPACLQLRDTAGEPVPESLVLFRENPFCGPAGANVCLLATLTQEHPLAEPARAARLVERYARERGLDRADACRLWFERFVDAVVEPPLIAHADYGLLYGAHRHNLIIGFDGALPTAGWFRDCRGIGFSRLGAELLRPHLPPPGDGTDNIIDDVLAQRLLVNDLIINSTFGLIGALGAAGLLPEEALLQQLRVRLETLAAGPRRDRGCLEYLLGADALWAKGNFRCAITGLDESTSIGPMMLDHRLPNPLPRWSGLQTDRAVASPD